MSKEVTKKEDYAISTEDMSAWGEQELTSNDFIISKILPMQGLSKPVTERKAQIGEYRDSVTNELLGSIDEPMAFIPFHVDRLWIVQKQVNGKFEYQGTEPITRDNEERKWEMVVDGIKHRYDWNYTFYVVRPQDIEEGMPTPYILNMRRTSVRGGKKLMTQMFIRNRQMKLPPAGYVMNLEGKLQSNDKGSYVVLDVSTDRKATQDEVLAAFELYKMVKASAVNIDHTATEY